ncbi:MAG: AsnC family transcriptional regulator [Burkholderiales bacterium]|nr:AsnC family transcriptional regulator [Burkholderiales bacterium]
MTAESAPVLDAADRALVRATQAGLPLTPRPYHTVGERLGMDGEEVIVRLQRMHTLGIVRRVAAVPNHYALGYTANGMSVWDVCDARIDALGTRVGELPFVSHCYRRPRHLPDWPYNLFAMVHARTREEIAAQVAQIRALLGEACREHDVLYSTRILKKTGLRIGL